MVLLDQARQDYILDVCRSAKANPKNDSFKNIILPPLDRPDLPKLFLWCPISQYGCRVVCLKHFSEVRAGEWLDNVTKRCNRNPRLAFDVFENIIFIQRIYRCSSGLQCGGVLSNDIDVMEQLPKEVSRRFPFQKYHLSVYSHDFIDYMFEQILRGLPITKITDSLVNLRASKYARKEVGTSRQLQNFTEDEIYSFPSKSNMRNIIIDEFRRTEHFYKSSMESLEVGDCISVYEIKRNSGDLAFGAAKFSFKDRQVYIILNEQNQVVSWKLCAEITPDVIAEVLEPFCKLESCTGIKTILIDNCCQEKDLYQTFFPNAEVKMTIFNAIKLITTHLPNQQSFNTLSLVKRFGQVFRSSQDIGKTQQENSPAPEKIIENLSEFIDHEKSVLEALPEQNRSAIDEALRSLITHIQSGCLSDIKPGFTSEPCEKLHRQLKKSVLMDAVTPSVEFIEAVLSISFHHYNEKKKGNHHVCSKDVVVYPARQPFIPDHTSDIKAAVTKILQITPSQVHPDRITISEFLWKKTFYLMQTSYMFKKKFRMVDIVNLLFLKELGFEFPEGNALTDLEITLVETTVDKGIETLINAVLDQLKYHGLVDVQNKFDISPNTEDNSEAIKIFLEHILTACHEWEISFKLDDLDLKDESVRLFICEVIVEMLSVPVAVIQSEQVGNISLLIPDQPSIHNTLLVIGYKASNGLFYSAMPEVANAPGFGPVSNEDPLKKQCRCGWKGKSAECCTPESSCSCIADKRGCIDCRCNIVRCKNKADSQDPLINAPKHRDEMIQCRCGKGDKCCSGKRCPCFNAKQGCIAKCECCGGKCNNIFGKNTADTREKLSQTPADQKKTRKRRRDTILTRGRKIPKIEEMDEEGEPIWKEYDVAALVVCLQTLKKTQIEITPYNVYHLYKILVDDHFIHVGKKSMEQIQEKLTVLQIDFIQDESVEVTTEEIIGDIKQEILMVSQDAVEMNVAQ